MLLATKTMRQNWCSQSLTSKLVPTEISITQKNKIKHRHTDKNILLQLEAQNTQARSMHILHKSPSYHLQSPTVHYVNQHFTVFSTMRYTLYVRQDNFHLLKSGQSPKAICLQGKSWGKRLTKYLNKKCKKNTRTYNYLRWKYRGVLHFRNLTFFSHPILQHNSHVLCVFACNSKFRKK